MIPVTTKEHLIYFMQCGVMRLGKYDLRFVQNLHLLTVQNKTITTNQVALVDKLVDKYKRQLHKQGITSDQLASLKWESAIVNSDPQFTEAYVTITNDTITFKSPFNKKFIDNFRKVEHNTFAWIKDNKIYESPYSTEALKTLLTVANAHYPVVNYCPVVSNLLNSVDKYSAKYWNPTLIKCNDIYLIAGINERLDDAIKDMPLSNNPCSLSILASYGVSIDERIIDNDPLLEFASSFISEVDYKDVDNIVQYLLAIKCDSVTIVGQAGMTLHYRKILAEKIKNSGIHLDDDKNGMVLEARLEGKKIPVVISLSSNLNWPAPNFKKIVRMRNSLPVVIK
jgi:hypothetical protein